MNEKELSCPCGLRDFMEADDCERADCNMCCPIKRAEAAAGIISDACSLDGCCGGGC